MRFWEQLSDYEQIMIWWDFLANCPDDDHISFEEFNKMMTGFAIA